jgi:hypothetical protein
MALPIWNNNGAQPLITAANFCSIVVAVPQLINQGSGQNSGPMIEFVSYLIVGGSTGVGTVLTFQELGPDGVWRAIVSPAPVTIANSTTVNGAFTGPFHGLRLALSGLVGNGASYAELKGTVRQNG